MHSQVEIKKVAQIEMQLSIIAIIARDRIKTSEYNITVISRLRLVISNLGGERVSGWKDVDPLDPIKKSEAEAIGAAAITIFVIIICLSCDRLGGQCRMDDRLKKRLATD